MIKMIDVTKTYPDGTKAVKGISMEIDKGETMILIGPSGCGKTTLLKTINCLIPHTSGEILINGTNVLSLDEIKLRRQMGYVIQQIGLFPHLNILDNTTFVLKLNKVPLNKRKDRAEELLNMVGLNPAEYIYRYPNQLSGGQQQRIGVARALAADPEIILMDEPFGALDPITREQVQNEFLKLQSTFQKTIVFVTHDIQEARKMGDRISIMKEGHLVQVGSVYRLYKHPVDKFVEDFIGANKVFQLLEAVSVDRAASRDVPVCSLEQPITEIREAADDAGWDSVFMVDQRGHYLGTLSRERLEKNRGARPEEECIDPAKTAISTDSTLSEAVETMLMHNCSYIPLLDNEGKLHSIVTFSSIYHLLAS